MKNKKGFTLVELLAVIVVLGIVSIIAVTSIAGIRRKAADDTYNELVKMLEDLGPQIYSHEVLVNKNGDFYTRYKNNGYVILTTAQLKEMGYINGEIKNPYKKDDTCNGTITVKKTATGPEFEVTLNCSDPNTNSTEEEEEESPIEDSGDEEELDEDNNLEENSDADSFDEGD